MTQWILTSSLLILVVLLIRAVGRDKLSARLRYALWGLVLLRLLMPFSIGESVLSVQNFLPKETHMEQVQTEPILIDELIDTQETNPTIEMPVIPIDDEGTSRTFINLPVLIWVIGSIITALIFIISNLCFAAQLRRSRQKVMHRFVPVYVTEAIDTPCLFGLWRPGIYVPSEVWENETALRHVLSHELTHYRHKDHIWSVLRCVCVSMHWYNPLVWMAAVLSQKDAEMACDEGTLQRLGEQERIGYAKTLVDLNCVGYKGVLTAATSMTGSESDLKQRVLRIVKNPKMSAIAVVLVLAVVIAAALAVFTGAQKPAIEGVWKMEMTALGLGEPAEAHIEVEFSDGRCRYTMYHNGEVRFSESFTYTLDGDTVILELPELEEGESRFGDRIQEHPWSVEDDVLTIGRNNNEMHLTAVERKSVPYLPDGIVSIHFMFSANHPAGLHYVPDETTQAKLWNLLRSAEVNTVGGYARGGVPCEEYSYILHHEDGQLIIADDMVVVEDSLFKDGYALSNIAEIKALLESLPWEISGDHAEDDAAVQFAPNLETDGFVPADMVGIVDARMILYGKGRHADPEQLAFLEELLSTAVDIGYPTACPFEGVLEVKLSDGRVLGVVPALDSCSAFMIGDTCYDYGNQFAYDDEGSYDNSELLAVFGLNHDIIMELWEAQFEPTQGEAMGGLNDQGDVIRVLNDVMGPTRLPDGTKETIIALLAEGVGESMGEADVEFDSLYYTILFETMGAADGYVTLSDNGSLYRDGVRHELTTAEAILQLLDAHYNELRITQEGYGVTQLSGVTGEFLYVELNGLKPDAQVRWSTENEDVCTVTGDAMGAEIYITGSGMAAVTVEWQENNTSKSDSVVVYGDRESYATAISEAALTAAEDMARKDYEAWRNEDYCIRMDVLLSDVDEAESVRLRMMYDGFETGWTKEYLAENFVAVRVSYDCELDHEKTFLDDGIVTEYTLLVRDNANAPWRIWDYSIA